jgi:hypothetical protein
MIRKLRPLAALAMVALIGVGCSDAPDENFRAASVSPTEALRTV